MDRIDGNLPVGDEQTTINVAAEMIARDSAAPSRRRIGDEKSRHVISIMSANRDRALHLLFRTISPGVGDPADDLIARLTEIKAARSDLLTDDEYDDWRGMVLKQIVEPTQVPLAWRITLAVGCLGTLALVVYGIVKRSGGPIVGGAAGLVTAAYLWYGLERDYLAKRDLSRATRMSIIERLVQEQLVSETEARELSSKVLAAFPADMA